MLNCGSSAGHGNLKEAISADYAGADQMLSAPMSRRSILKKNDAFLVDGPADVAAVLLRACSPGAAKLPAQVFKRVSGVERRSVSRHLHLPVQLIRSGLGENFDSPVPKLVVLGRKRILIDANLTNRRFRRQLPGRKSINVHLAAIGARRRPGQRLQLRRQFIRIVRERFQVLPCRTMLLALFSWLTSSCVGEGKSLSTSFVAALSIVDAECPRESISGLAASATPLLSNIGKPRGHGLDFVLSRRQNS